MELRQLRYFLGVVAAGSFGKAANQLHVAQPALSRQVKALEDDLGVQLLYRTAQGVHVTEAGERLRDLAESLMRSVENMRSEVTHLSREPNGSIVIGLPPSLAQLITTHLIETCEARYPMVTVRIIEALSVFLLDWLELGKIDVAILTDPRDAHAIERRDLAREDMVLVGIPGRFPADATSIRLHDLLQYRIVISQGFERVMQPWCEAAGFIPRYAMQLDSIPILQDMVRRGRYCTIVPYGMVHADVAAGRLRALPFEPEITRRVVLGFSSRRPVSITMSAIFDLLDEEIGRIQTSVVGN